MNRQEIINKLEKQKYSNPIAEYQRAYNYGIDFALSYIKYPNITKIADKYDENNTSTTPSHYQGTTQPIDLINAQNLNFNLGNVVKYVCRAGKKDGENILSDLEKAKNYINYEIERVKNNE